MPTTPTDPLYASQWHFGLIGDIETIWDEYTGMGVNVGVYDSGVDYNHEDLSGNYDSSLHIVDNLLNPVDPFPTLGDAHGTACAGLIGASANNGVGGVGVAHGVSLTGVNIFDNTLYGFINAANTDSFMDAAHQATNFDVMSNSWGSTPSYTSGQNLNGVTGTSGQNGFAADLEVEYAHLSLMGRGGLGTSIIQASGNDNRNANGSGTNASRYTVTVSATEMDGTAASYTNHGSSILVAAPAAAVTTDITGAPGYDPGNYTASFNGTSAATPVVAGVVSLMLEANPELGWRDIQNILAISSSHTGSAFGGAGTGFEDGAWYSTTAGNWNGGGHTFHDNYGFGMVDAFAAVRMAEIWTHMNGGSAVSAGSGFIPMAPGVLEEQHVAHDSGTVNLLIGDGNAGVGVAVTDVQAVASDIEIENIQLTIDMSFNFNGSVLEIFLIAPDGTRFEVVDKESYFNPAGGLEWTFEITGALGMSSMGNWTLEVTDIDGFSDVGTVADWQLDFYGSTASVNDIHTITDDFLMLAGIEAGRTTLDDMNGGFDWLNMAAIQGDIKLDLLRGTFEVGGVDWASVAINTFEGAAGGDGNDTIYGGDPDNELLGMRGNDRLFGENGEDTLDGGTGNDTLNGGRDNDILNGGIGDDVLNGNRDHDTLFGGEGNDTLRGGDNNDVLDGGEAADTVYGGAGNDRITDSGSFGSHEFYGESGNDTIAFLNFGTNYNDGGDDIDTILLDTFVSGTFDLTAGNWDNFETWINFENVHGTVNNNNSVTVVGTSGANRIDFDGTGANDLSGLAGNDTIFGGGGNDTINGGGDNDVLRGEDDNDLMSGQSGNDSMNGGQGDDTLDGGLDDDVLLGAGGQDSLLGGTGNDTLNGGGAKDYLNGGNDNDSLLGGGGNDTLLGGNGDDTLVGGDQNDSLSGNDNNDFLQGNSGNDTLIGGNGDDTGFGGEGDDLITGNSGMDDLRGSDGNDTLLGGSENDILSGGNNDDSLNGASGMDTIIGGEGADTLYGGGDADEFRYNAISDSLNGPARDSIMDFAVGVDLMDLSRLSGPPLDMAIGGLFTGTGASARTLETGGNTLVMVDIDGDTLADFRVDVMGTTGMTLSDFLL